MKQLNNAFKASVAASISDLMHLKDVLYQEQEALSGDDAEQLERVVASKIVALKQLEPSLSAREQIQHQAGLSNGLKGGDDFVKQNFTPADIAAEWKQLLTLSKEVEAINTENGKLALAGERSTREAIGILTGRQQHNDTYGKKVSVGSPISGMSHGKC